MYVNKERVWHMYGDAGVSKRVGDGEVTEEDVDMSECVWLFESMRDEVAVLLPVVTDAVVSVTSKLIYVAVSNEIKTNWWWV